MHHIARPTTYQSRRHVDHKTVIVSNSIKFSLSQCTRAHTQTLSIWCESAKHYYIRHFVWNSHFNRRYGACTTVSLFCCGGCCRLWGATSSTRTYKIFSFLFRSLHDVRPLILAHLYCVRLSIYESAATYSYDVCVCVVLARHSESCTKHFVVFIYFFFCFPFTFISPSKLVLPERIEIEIKYIWNAIPHECYY